MTAILSLCALLFTQTALAAYSCHGPVKAMQVADSPAMVEVAQPADAAEAAMPCASSMAASAEVEQASLCHAHCQSAQKSVDNLQPPPLANVAELGAVLTVKLPASPEFTGISIQASLLRLSASPPLAISHCCLRI